MRLGFIFLIMCSVLHMEVSALCSRFNEATRVSVTLGHHLKPR